MNVDRRRRVESLYLKLVGSSESGELPGPEELDSADADLYPDLQVLHREQLHLEKFLAEIVPLAGKAQSSFHHASPLPELDFLRAREPDLEPGVVLAGFELVRPLGKGGMGLVWQARQLSLDRPVALKLIRPDHVTAATVRRFNTEARAAGRLNHPGLVSVLDTGVHEGRHWIAQELVDGGCTLRETIEAHRRAGLQPRGHYPRVAELFAQIAEAMQVAHDAGVVHRDIKPQNILITRDDRPKVGDFGLAHLVGEDSFSRLGPVGTVHYMSPEQVRADGEEVDARSDVFSLGAVLYEMLALKRPFEGDSHEQILACILNREARDPRVQQPSVPADLAVIALGALEKHRSDRYPSMAELAADLRRYLRHEPILRKPPGAWVRARKWVRRHPTWSATIALGALLAVVVAVLVPEVMAQRQRALDFHKDSLHTKALRDIDRGRLASAGAWIQEAVELDPQDPRGHLYMAAGYAQYAQYREAEREIEAALAKGFSTSPPPLDGDAEQHRAYAIYLIVTAKSRGHSEAEVHLARALELDPEIEGSLYSLYQIRKERGDVEGAREALLALRRRLETGDDFFPMVEALLAELDGNSQAALDLLATLGSLPQERLLGLRYDLIVGRNQLKLGQLESAQASLERMVDAMPESSDAWENLAEIHLRRFEAGSTYSGSSEELRLADEAAERATSWDPGRARPFRLRAKIALHRIERRSVAERYAPIPDDLLADARTRLDELREVDPGDPLLALMEADFLLDQALPCIAAKDRAQAIDLLERSIHSYGENLLANLLLAQQRWMDGEFDASLELCDRVIELWSPERDPRWIFAAHVWAFGAASKLENLNRAREARDNAEELLASGSWEEASEELLSLAEFLALATREDLQDCVRAKEVIETYRLRHVFRDHAQAAEILALIDAACP